MRANSLMRNLREPSSLGRTISHQPCRLRAEADRVLHLLPRDLRAVLSFLL